MVKGLFKVFAVVVYLCFEAAIERFSKLLLPVGSFVTLLVVAASALHHFVPSVFATLYVRVEKNAPAVAARWKALDSRCEHSMCAKIFPSPLRFYELHSKEQMGYAQYLTEASQRSKNAFNQLSTSATASQIFIAQFIPEAKHFYAPITRTQPDTAFRAMYLTGTSARAAKIDQHFQFSASQNLNAVVFDIKDVYGFVNYRSSLSEVNQIQGRIVPPLGDLRASIANMKSRKLHTIARVALFQDELQAQYYPERRIFLKSGDPLLTKGRSVWIDPNHPDVQRYNLSIIREVLQAGADEIQLDYVRYPAEGAWRDAAYRDLQSHEHKPFVITGFLQKAYALTRSYGALLSLDVFGVVAWQEKLDIKSTGQNMAFLSQAADVISPMLYPSHFGLSFGNIKNPADQPELFLYEGCMKLREIIPENKSIRPWLQAFAWRVSHYSPQYITRQIAGARKAQAKGYLLWNAKNTYPRYSEN